MTIRVRFEGGPIHGQFGNVGNLPQCQIFFATKRRQVFCYNRYDELVYVYEPEISKALTEQYDTAFAKFGENGTSVESWGKKPHAA